MIVNIDIRRCENGFVVRYEKDGKSHERVFIDWNTLCNWMYEQVGQ